MKATETLNNYNSSIPEQIVLKEEIIERLKETAFESILASNNLLSGERIYETYSTYLFADKMSRKKSLEGLEYCVNVLENHKNEMLRLWGLHFVDKHYLCILYDNKIIGLMRLANHDGII